MKKRHLMLFGLLLLSGAKSVLAQSQWQWANPLPTGNFTTGLIWDGHQFVGVDDAGGINMSADGITWSIHTSGSPSLHAIASGGSQYVAVGFSGEIRTSPDGVTWTARSSGTTETLWAVAWADNRFVAVGGTWNGDPDSGDAVILTSDDGIAWTSRHPPAGLTAQLFALTWDGHQLVAVGFYGTILTSPEGVVWTAQTSGTQDNLDSVAFSGSKFAAAGQFGTLLTSPDGTTWSVVQGTVAPSFDKILWTRNRFVAIGGGGAIVTSPDGNDWTAQASGTDDRLYSIAASPSAIVTIGVQGTVLQSTDDTTWNTVSTSLTKDTLTSIAWNGRRFVTTGDGGSVLVSADATFWDVLPATLPFISNAIAWGNSQFVIVGDDGSIATSPDGDAWTQQSSSTSANLHGVAWGDHQFVAVGQLPGSLMTGPGEGVILTSSDGSNWILANSHAIAGDNINSVVWSGDRFVAVGGGPTPVFSSADGHQWTRIQLAPGSAGPALLSVTWSGDLFVAVGNAGQIPIDPRVIVTSPNGTDWAFQPAPIDNVFYATGLTSVVWSGEKFIAVGGFGIELSSFDGTDWISDTTISVAQFGAIAATGSRCVAVGLEGAIMVNETCGNEIFKDDFETQ